MLASGGHFRYIAPEVAFNSTRKNEASDIYSLSMTIYNLSMRSDPFDSKDTLWVVNSVVDGKRPEEPRTFRIGGLHYAATETL